MEVGVKFFVGLLQILNKKTPALIKITSKIKRASLTVVSLCNRFFLIEIFYCLRDKCNMHMLNKISQNFDFTFIYYITNLQIDSNIIPVSIAVPKLCYFLSYALYRYTFGRKTMLYSATTYSCYLPLISSLLRNVSLILFQRLAQISKEL